MENLRKSSILKMLCYILIPILFAVFLFSIIHMEYLVTNEENIQEISDYKDTQSFANEYFYALMNELDYINSTRKDYSKYIQINDTNTNEVYQYLNRNYESGIYKYLEYIIIQKDTGEMYTNVKSANYESLKEEMKQKTKYWILKDGKIETNLDKLNEDRIKYYYSYQSMLEQEAVAGSVSWSNYEIYTAYSEQRNGKIADFELRKQVETFMLQNQTLPIYMSVITFCALLIIALYLFWAIGYKQGSDKVVLSQLDKFSYEVVSFTAGAVTLFFLVVWTNAFTGNYYSGTVFSFMSYIISYIACAIWGITTIKRIKARMFFKTFTSYKIIKYCWKKLSIFIKEFDTKTLESKKMFWYYWGFIICTFLLFSTGNFLIFVGLVAFVIWVYYRIRKYINQQEYVKDVLKEIYQGNINEKIDDKDLTGVLKEMSIYINDISSGLSNAIQDNVKAERLKAELITNVSHDIKTPLTSIINYVDLLKKEKIEDKVILEYIDILDRKSQRLKKLTEDLIEASKVSSGNVKLNIEKIRLKELIHQSMGEFKDKFEERNLIVEIEEPKENVMILADNRYMYRIIENLFSNISKYALAGSRVYIDIIKKEHQVEIIMKNVSKDRLNITSDELMQRFVRGDRARFTEGSGLGLSIAQSLTELQGGTFAIEIDGDLFKTYIKWNI